MLKTFSDIYSIVVKVMKKFQKFYLGPNLCLCLSTKYGFGMTRFTGRYDKCMINADRCTQLSLNIITEESCAFIYGTILVVVTVECCITSYMYACSTMGSFINHVDS